MSALFGLAIAALLWWGLKLFASSSPAQVATLMKRLGGAVALLMAGFLLLRGQLEIAALVGGTGAWLLGWAAMPQRLGRFGRPLRSSTGSLGELDLASLLRLRRDALGRDPDRVRLLEADLDRRFAGWREYAETGAHDRGRADAKRGPMTEQEAYQVLGLQPGEGADAVRAAHRALMKKLHPDQGGSTYLASRVNQAKDVLLNRHR